MSMMLPVDHSIAMGTGATATTPFAVSGIKSGDELLAVVAYAPGADPIGIDVSEGTVADGTVALDTTSTASKLVWVMWITPRD